MSHVAPSVQATMANDERVGEFLNRPLTGEWPYVWLDATYLKVRQGGRIVSVAAIIAVAANTEGRREIIGLGLGPSEAETFWMDFLRSLKARGLEGVKLVISDAHSGLKGAIARVFEAPWQPPRSGRHSTSPTAPMPVKPGARSPISSARAGLGWQS